MKIAYWSPVHGHGKTTSNLSFLSYLTHKVHGYCIMNLDMNFLMKDMETMFLNPSTIVVGENFTEDIGIDALSRNIKVEELTKDSIHNCSISLLHSGYHILPSTRKLQEESFEERLIPVLPDILKALDKYYDMLFIDTANGFNNKVTDIILNISDIIVVNLPQNQLVLKKFFSENPMGIYSDKIVYCIGAYDKRSIYNKYNLKRIYHKELKQGLGVIPYQYNFMDAISKGTLLNYFEQIQESKQYEDKLLIEEGSRMIKLLLDKKNFIRR